MLTSAAQTRLTLVALPTVDLDGPEWVPLTADKRARSQSQYILGNDLILFFFFFDSIIFFMYILH